MVITHVSDGGKTAPCNASLLELRGASLHPAKIHRASDAARLLAGVPPPFRGQETR
jgi:hypothetical protein